MLRLLAALLVTSQGEATSPPTLPALEKRLELHGLLHDFALDSKGTRVVTITPKDGGIALWKLADGAQLWRSEELGTRWVSFCEGDKRIVCGMGIPAVTLVDAKDGRKLASNGFPIDGPIHSFVSDPDGRWAWLGLEQGLLRLVPGDVSGWSRRSLEGGGARVLALDEDATWLAAGCKDGAVRFANSKSASVDDKKVIAGCGSPISALAFGPKVLVTAAEDGSLRTWALTSQKEKSVLASGAPVVRALAVEPRAGWLAAGDERGNLVLWSLDKGLELARWTVADGSSLVALQFAPKEKRLYAAAGKQLLTLDLRELK